MACHSKRSAFSAALALAFLLAVMTGCVTLRVIKVNDGKDMSQTAAEFTAGKATLDDILAKYGAPTDIVDLQGRTALIYERSYYRGNQLSIGIPFSEISGVNANLTGYGNLLRYDSLVFFVNPDGTVSHSVFDKGSSSSYWSSLFSD